MQSFPNRTRQLIVALPLLGLTIGCDSGAPPGDTGAVASPDFSAVAMVDLSYAYDAATLYWPTSPSAFELESLAFGETPAGFFYSANRLRTPEHGGTHLDAPIHFAESGWATADIPVDRLFGPAVVLDLSDAAAADPDYRLDADAVLAWEADHGRIPPGSIVLLHTGWGQFWPDARAYLGDDTPGDASNLHFPGFGESAARLLIDDRRVGMLGVDTASIDFGQSVDFIVHQIAGAANVPALENVANLDRLPATGSWVFALPIKIAGGSGGPARIVALVPRGG